MRLFSIGLLFASLPWLAGCGGTQAGEKPRPEVDRKAPAKVETATFALG
jgi:hypothetical protein